ncbi:MAG: hypothetical protein RBS80_12875 [Thermoguttaceae bacterium]|nr:hypothetical protein [Thermoguttaceae bacterium]
MSPGEKCKRTPANQETARKLGVFRKETVLQRDKRMEAVLGELADLADAMGARGVTYRPDNRQQKQRCNSAWSIIFYRWLGRQRVGKGSQRSRLRTGKIQAATWYPGTGRLRIGTLALTAETTADAVGLVLEHCGGSE